MPQRKQWKELIRPGITAIVGAGGKSTVLRKLVEYGRLSGVPTLVTTTTKMYLSQVADWNPYMGDDFNEGEHICAEHVQAGRCASWFGGQDETKVTSLATTEIDAIHHIHPDWHILVEADGAKEKWLKAPRTSEPVIPTLTQMTVGVVNLQMLGKPLLEEHVHNLDLVLRVLEVEKGSFLSPTMLVDLINHPAGLFQYSRGEKILFCTGYDTLTPAMEDEFLEALTDSPLEKVFLADGFRESCEIKRVLTWKSV